MGKNPILTNIFQMGWNHQPVFLFKLHLSVYLLKMSHMDGRMEDFKKKELKELESLGDTDIQELCCLVGFWLHDHPHTSSVTQQWMI